MNKLLNKGNCHVFYGVHKGKYFNTYYTVQCEQVHLLNKGKSNVKTPMMQYEQVHVVLMLPNKQCEHFTEHRLNRKTQQGNRTPCDEVSSPQN